MYHNQLEPGRVARSHRKPMDIHVAVFGAVDEVFLPNRRREINDRTVILSACSGILLTGMFFVLFC